MRNKHLYPEEWQDTIRPRILKRDEYKCTKCGIKHRTYVLVDSSKNRTIIDKQEHDEYKQYVANVYRVFLQVAHLDNIKSHNEDSNLASMCPYCHHLYDKAHKRVMLLAPKKKETMWIGTQGYQSPPPNLIG